MADFASATRDPEVSMDFGDTDPLANLARDPESMMEFSSMEGVDVNARDPDFQFAGDEDPNPTDARNHCVTVV